MARVHVDVDGLERQIIDILLTRLPAEPDTRDFVCAVVAALRLGPRGATALLACLTTDEDPLASGRSDGPPQRLRLLERWRFGTPITS